MPERLVDRRGGRRWLAAAALVFGFAAPCGASELLVYPQPPVPEVYTYHNDDYTVRVRAAGGDWRDLYEYRIRVDWDHPQDASMVYFDFTGTVELEVEKNNGGFSTVSVSPLSSSAKLSRRGKIIHVTLSQPQGFSLQFDDDRLHNLHILAGAPPAPPPTGANYFSPGIHVPPAGADRFPVKSGDTFYLAGGAILKGRFAIEALQGVRIMGRGLIYNPGKAIDIDRSRDVSLADFILVNDDTQPAARVSNVRNSENVRMSGISGFTAGKWSDGINISTSRHIAVDHVYLRTSDDAIVVYAVTDCLTCDSPIPADGPPGSDGPADTFDIKVTNSVLWADVAHAMYVGHFGDNAAPRTIRDIVFDNIDVANLDEDDPAWQGAMAIFSGDSTLIRNVRFSNIRVDRIEEGKLFNIVAGGNPRYNEAPGRGVEDVTLRDIAFTGEELPGASVVSGLSEGTAVRQVLIKNLRINGHHVRAAAEGDIRVGPFANGITIR